jgi:hypothetical protein
LPDFHLIFRVLTARARSDVAQATFTLTSTPKAQNLGVKLQATGEISGLGGNELFRHNSCKICPDF